jgi:branched-chain amino acid transport system ATP-binding protein
MFAPADAERDATERAVNAFPRLGERLSQIAGTLSGGEQQMLAIARAYTQSAPLVMLDEVSMGLAPIIVDEIFDSLDRMSKEGTSLLLVEQYVAKALQLADFAYLLVRGRLVFAGEPAEIQNTDIFNQYLGAEVGYV